MMLEADSGLRGTVLDLDTGRVVPKVCRLDVEAGYLEAFDACGRRYAARGRFRFVAAKKAIVLGAPKCRCGSQLTLPGEDLCAPCRARDRGQRVSMRVERIVNPLLDRKCERCSRLAEFCVGDEVETTPVISRGVQFLRAATVGRRYLCSWHFQPPRLLDARGEAMQDLETGVRP